MEQPAWNPKTQTFFVSIPALAGSNNPGGVTEISVTGSVLQTFDFGTMGVRSCSPTGLGVSASGNMMVGCGNVGAAAILINSQGQIIKTVPGLGVRTSCGTTRRQTRSTSPVIMAPTPVGSSTWSPPTATFSRASCCRRPQCAFDHGKSVQRRCFRGARRHQRAEPLPGEFCKSGLHRSIRRHPGGAGAHRRCWSARPDLGERWSSRLVATASAIYLSAWANHSSSFIRQAPTGERSENDYDVVADDVVVGHIMKISVVEHAPWRWMITHHEGHT